MNEWKALGGGTVEITATGIYIEGEFLEDTPTTEGPEA